MAEAAASGPQSSAGVGVPGRFLVTRPIPGPGLSMLQAAGPTTVLEQPPTHGELAELCSSGDFDVVLTQLTDRVDRSILEDARLRGISNYAVGHDNIDVGYATQRHIMVGNTPGVLTDPTADLTMLLILATARRCLEGDAMMREGRFKGWEPTLLLGADVSGQRLGLIGWGRIARAVARRALGFGMDVCVTTVHNDNRPLSTQDRTVPGGTVTQVDLTDLLTTSHFVSLHVPLAEQTHHLIDASVLDGMRPDAILINTSRGPVVDEHALVEALRAGTIAGAGLDVYEAEPTMSEGLGQLTNTVLLPHLGSATRSVRAEMSRLAASNALAMARGEAPPHPVTVQRAS